MFSRTWTPPGAVSRWPAIPASPPHDSGSRPRTSTHAHGLGTSTHPNSAGSTNSRRRLRPADPPLPLLPSLLLLLPFPSLPLRSPRRRCRRRSRSWLFLGFVSSISVFGASASPVSTWLHSVTAILARKIYLWSVATNTPRQINQLRACTFCQPQRTPDVKFSCVQRAEQYGESR